MPWVKDEPTSLEQKVNLLRRFRGQFDLGEDYVFGIFNKSETELIGSTGLHTRVAETAREIGYWIQSEHIGRGLATETVSALTKVGFEIEQLSNIEIHCSSENLRSQRVPARLGYKLQPIPQQPAGNNFNAPTDKKVWIMSKEDYHRSPIRLMQLKAFDILEEEIAW